MRRLALAAFAATAFVANAFVATVFAAPAFAEVKVGDPAPDFTLKDQDGQDVKLSSFKGQKTVLVAFYPKDFSPGCTNEMKAIVADYRKLRARDVMVLGISGDTVDSHCKFAKTLGVQFKLLADADFAVAKLFDVVAPTAAGSLAIRSAFLVDKDGKVRWLDRSLKVPIGNLDGSEILAQVEKVAAQTDPVASLAELPPEERDGKTVFIRFAQAFLGEDMTTLEAIVDPEACAKPGETPQMQRDRRKAMMDRWRSLFDKNDLKSLRFDDVVDVRGSKVLTKEGATSAALTVFGSDARAVAGRLGDGELLVVGKTTGPKLGEVQVFAREVVLRLKKTGDAWKIIELIN